MREDEEQQSLFRDFRVIVFIIAIFASIIFIQPGYSSEEGFTTGLNYGLDLEGGSWLQVKLQGATAQLDADAEALSGAVLRNEIGDSINIVNVNTDNEQLVVTFTTTEQLTTARMDQLGLGQSTVTRENNVTEVVFYTSKSTLITSYLSDTLKAEVIPERTDSGSIEYEIRTPVSQEDLERIMSNVGGYIVRGSDGTPIYREGVREETRDLTKDILSEKLNTLGLKDIPVRVVGDDYILIDFAGMDLATAQDIASKPGKFEIRIATQGNASRHVLYGDEIQSVGIAGYNDRDGQWYTPFTLTDAGALALQRAAIETGATTDPMSHNLIMYLDENEVYSAPLSSSAAATLSQYPIYSWQASTGGDEESRAKAEQLQIHLRAGALPVKVEIIGSGQVDASLGEQFRSQAIFAGLMTLLAVAAVVYRRYRKPEILLPMIGIVVSEVIMILGFAGAIGWQLDLPSIAGIIAVMGTGIDHLVIITDEVLYEGKLPPRKVYLARITKAFAIIFAAAATTVIAMSPLVVMGFGALKGFAITTIVGVLIGILIARPVYAKIIHSVLEASAEKAASKSE
ncbi:MAG: preprotein translocase subunit SecD [Methanolobus sp.]|uniref:preprotein translocase subunit SecD n=1 Tax=Methanolobus sp. TaxID=1874737 RepID=UPI00273123FB|nr:preprotein translocase subunit SecD [Methanolobus sp.]MDP2217637.1 preprotein translocase subunit SecD [Methanolobus sp.]